MGTLCLSSAAILRCETLNRIQSEVLIIPAALELLCSTSLVFIRKDAGSFVPGLFLFVEGWMYFSLALLDLLSHILPAARDSVMVFSIIDTALASASFLPIMFYMLFLFFLMRAEFVGDLPQRFQNIAKMTLLFFVPTVIALNELASFVGITRRIIHADTDPVLAIGFRNDSDQTIWTFFTSFTLALHTAFQAMNFCFVFYRVIKVFVDKRNMESLSYDANHLIRGTGWIAGGVKLGAIETLIGFAQGGFGGALTRRILRFFSRLFLVIGLIKGLDTVEDFQQFRKEMQLPRNQDRRGSKLRALISNPRISTFRRISSMPPGFTTQEPVIFSPKIPVTPKERVTVQFEQNRAPTLLLRFSALDLPTATALQESIASHPSTPWSTYPATFLDMSNNTTKTTQISGSPRVSSSFLAVSRTPSAKSVPDTINAVVEIAPQFPSLPPLSKGKDAHPYSWLSRGVSSSFFPEPLPTIHSSNSSINEAQQQPTTPPSAIALGKMRAADSDVPLPSTAGRDVYGLLTPQSAESFSSANTNMSHVTTLPPQNAIAGTGARFPLSPDRASGYSSDQYNMVVGGARGVPQRRALRLSIARDDLSARLQEQARSGVSPHELDWPPHADISDDESAQIHNVVTTRKAEVAKIKSVGNAPRKTTPAPTPTRTTRGSVVAELLGSAAESRAAAAAFEKTKQRRRLTNVQNGRLRIPGSR